MNEVQKKNEGSVLFLVIIVIGRGFAGDVLRHQEPVNDVDISIGAFNILAGDEGCVHLNADGFEANLLPVKCLSQFVRDQVNMFYFS